MYRYLLLCHGTQDRNETRINLQEDINIKVFLQGELNIQYEYGCLLFNDVELKEAKILYRELVIYLSMDKILCAIWEDFLSKCFGFSFIIACLVVVYENTMHNY